MLRIHPTLHVTLADVQRLLTDLHEKGLLQTLRYGQGAALLKHYRKERRQRIWNAVRNSLSALPGWDPERTLAWLHDYLAWVFRPWAVAFA